MPLAAAAESRDEMIIRIYGCKVDTDCAVIEQICPYTWQAINVQSVEEYTKDDERIRPAILCEKTEPKQAPEKAVCLENKCRLSKEEK
ncbi:MAG: hypothetical protein WBK55_01610 [Alphaproteobacteria bacterium]